MNCEQENFLSKVEAAREQKEKFLSKPDIFVRMMTSWVQRLRGSTGPEELWLKAVEANVATMNDKELLVLVEKLNNHYQTHNVSLDTYLNPIFKKVLNCLKICQEVRGVSCVKMVPDL